MRKLYFVEWPTVKNVVFAHVVKETKCYLWLDRYGVNCSKQVPKSAIGVFYFRTFDAAVRNVVDRARLCVKSARAVLLREEQELEKCEKWAACQEE